MDSEWSYLVVTVVESMQLVELVFVEGFQISASSPTDKTRYSIRQTPRYASGVRPLFVEGYLGKIHFKWSKQHNVGTGQIWKMDIDENMSNIEISHAHPH